MKKLLLSLIALLPAGVFAQDIIYRTDGTRVETKVQEIGPEEIRYKMYNNPDGPVYVIKRKDVQLIAYQNGTHEQFSDVKTMVTDSLRFNKKKHLVSVDLFDMTFTNLSFSYEHIFGKGYFGIRIPVSMGLAALSNSSTRQSGNFLESRLWGTGIDMNYYPSGQAKTAYFVGASFIAGSFRYDYYRYEPYYYPPNPQVPGTYTGYHFAWLINNGVMIQPTKNLNITAVLGIGMKEDITKRSDYVQPNARISLALGYRF